MPLVTAKCSIVSNTMGGGISDYWIVSQTSSDPTVYVEATQKGLATQSDDSIIIAYWSTNDVDSSGNVVVQRFDTTGAITGLRHTDWSSYRNSTLNHNKNMIVVDDDIYCSFNSDFNGSSTNRAGFVFKVDSSFSSSTLTRYGSGTPTSENNYVMGIGYDDFQNQFVVTQINLTDDDLILKSYNSTFPSVVSDVAQFRFTSPSISSANIAGTIIFEKNSGTFPRGYCSLDVGLFGFTTLSFAGPTIDWAFTDPVVSPPSHFSTLNVYDMELLSDGKLVCFYYNVTGDYVTVSVWNTNGASRPTLSWAKSIESDLLNAGGALAVDSEDNIYVIFNARRISTENASSTIVKFDSSGNTLWQRRFISTGATSLYMFRRATVDSNDNLILSGVDNDTIYTAKLPSDGSGTGTYTLAENRSLAAVTVNYEPSNFTIVTPTGNIGTFNYSYSPTTVTGTTESSIGVGSSVANNFDLMEIDYV